MDAETASPRAWPEQHPEILPFLPLVYTAWADGILTPAELRALQAHVDAQSWVTEQLMDQLRPWLDPDQPPSPAELTGLQDRIRADAAQLDRGDFESLTDLGLALAGQRAESGPWEEENSVAALRALEGALGVVGRESVRRLLRTAAPEREARPGFGVGAAELHAYLDADQAEARAKVIGLLSHPKLRIPRGLASDEYREQVLEALHFLVEQGCGGIGFPEDHGGLGDPAAALATFETLAFGDLSVTVKWGVQFGLAAGAIFQLGNRRHHEAFLSDILSLKLPACYAMTETAHGSNVRDLRTLATYEHETRELVIQTPTDEDAKDWIGNAARHGRVAVVFARLRVGEDDHGVHAVIVPLRDHSGRALPGIRIEDRGLKEGLNGVDNGRIWFDRVRVPAANLLNRFGDLDDDGRYHSPIPSEGRRFFTMLGTLVVGRISIAAASVSAAKTGLAIAVRYGERRTQFGPQGAEQVPILDYLVHQRRLFPRLATTLGLHFALRDLQRRYAANPTDADREVEVRAAGLKAYASRHCTDTLQACREACGGQGFLAANRFGDLMADTDVFTTFEGSNPVLLQLVAKGLLLRFRHEVGDLRIWGVMRYLAERAQIRVASHNPLVTRRTEPEHLRDPDFHRASFLYREERLLRSVAQRLKRRIEAGVDSFQAMNECQDHLVELARAHVERIVLESFQNAVAAAPSPGVSEILASQCALHALSTLHRHRGWFLESGSMEPTKTRAIRAEVNELCRETRENARVLVDGFGIPDEVLAAPAAM